MITASPHCAIILIGCCHSEKALTHTMRSLFNIELEIPIQRPNDGSITSLAISSSDLAIIKDKSTVPMKEDMIERYDLLFYNE
jgi:hypothetical protein